MSKEKDIADIVKQLDSLSITDTQFILNYIEQSKRKKVEEERTQAQPPVKVYLDSEGTALKEGDKVILLTPGVDNHKYEEGRVHRLPQEKGKWIYLIPKRFFKNKFPFSIRKHSTNVRKVQE